jgi:hypothetical protein
MTLSSPNASVGDLVLKVIFPIEALGNDILLYVLNSDEFSSAFSPSVLSAGIVPPQQTTVKKN